MNDSNNLTFEIIEKVVTPIILLIAGFYFGNKSKKVEVDIEKIIDGDLYSSWGIRVAYWMVSYEILKDNPILGVGIGDYKQAIVETLEKEKFDNLPQEMKNFLTNFGSAHTAQEKAEQQALSKYFSW